MVTQVNASDTTATANTAVIAGTRRTGNQEGGRQTRVRIDDTVATPGPKLTPLQTALLHVESHTALLHDGLSTLLLERSKNLLLQRHKIKTKDMALSKLEGDTARLPASARIQFKLNVSKDVEETDRFKELNIRNQTVTEEYTKKLKAHVLEAGRLEIANMKAKLIEAYALAIHDTVAVYHISMEKPTAMNHPTALNIIAEHEGMLLKHTEANNFAQRYKEVNSVGDLTAAQQALVNDRRIEIKRTMEAIFVTPWDMYLQTYREQELVLSLKRHARETLLEAKTADATEIIDNEIPADRQQLQELIRTEALKIAKSIARPPSKQNKQKNKKMGQGQGASQRNGKKGNNRRDANRGRRNGPRGNDQVNSSSNQQGRRQNGADANNSDANRRNSRRPRSRSRSRQPSRRNTTGGNNGRQQS